MEKSISLIAVLVTFLLTTFLNTTNAKEPRGFIFTCPRDIKPGSLNTMNLRRFGDLSPGTLKIKIYYSVGYESPAAESSFDIPEGEASTNINLYVNKTENAGSEGIIRIKGNFGNYVINGIDDIRFSRIKNNIVIIQTDKPIYKTGQTVLFRIVKVNSDLKPSGGDEEADVWVEDAKSTRLFQWKNVPIGNGIKQLEFPLSNEPVLGMWKISVSVNKTITSTNFEVKEYVLPKYDITITLPPFVLFNAEEIPITVCAKYTYGKPVKGNLHLNVSYTQFARRFVKDFIVLQHTEKIDGCVNYTINLSRIEIEYISRFRQLQVVANVEEEGTGVTRNKTEDIPWQLTALIISFHEDKKIPLYFKPGLPFNGRLWTEYPDHTPASDEPIQICYTVSTESVSPRCSPTTTEKFCRNYTSDENGIVKYVIPPQNNRAVSVSVEAVSLRSWKVEMRNGFDVSLRQPRVFLKLSPWFSKSGSSIQLQHIQEVLKCGSKISIPILFTSKTSGIYKIYYQISKQRRILKNGFIEHNFLVDDDVSSEFPNSYELINEESVSFKSSPETNTSEAHCQTARDSYEPPVGKATIEIDVDASLSPSFHLLVYYIREDGETVADSTEFKVQKCFQNEVTLEFGDEVKQPGTKTSLHMKASPNSLCGIKVVDKSVSLLDSSDQLTKEGVFKALNLLNPGRFKGNRCKDIVPQPGLSAASLRTGFRRGLFIRSNSYSKYADSLAAWDDSGLLAISDLTLFSRPCKFHTEDHYGIYPRSRVAMRQPVIALGRPQAVPQTGSASIQPTVTKSAVEIRNYFPETWLFKMELTDSDGEFVTKERLPHTITEWVGSAVCINQQDGLGISDSTSIKGFQAFFISFTLPYSVIRRETFEIVVSIFNYVSDSLPVTVSLDSSDSFEVVGEFKGKDVCIAPGATENLLIKLKATKLGTSNITVHAKTAEASDICGNTSVSDAVAKDAMTYPVIVEAEGFPVEIVDSELFCVDDSNAIQKSIQLELPEDLVEDSQRAYIDVTGSVFGPSLDNLEQLIQLPTGCGEQNMVKFVPNILVYDLLSTTKALTPELKQRIVRNMNTGAQRQLMYRHQDGSYSAWGSRDKEGSMFLTAFVLRYFKLAQNFITIDNKTILEMQSWIVSKQDTDGCFPDVGKIVDMGVQGGIEKETSNGAITAYVLASLEISGYADRTVKDAALSCIRKDDNAVLQPFVTFLYAYTEALLGDTAAAKKRIEDIKPRANITGGMEYYPNVNASKSRNTETAAYALLAMFESGNDDNLLPLVQYLARNMNPHGGFSSTQDTCLGLQALAEFAKRTLKNPIDITLKITGGLEKEVSITENDKLVVKRNKISQVPSLVQLQGSGTGCALYQTVLRYNTKTPPGSKAFDFKVTGKCMDDECKLGLIKVEASYIPMNKKTGMALVEVKMVSGMTPVKESIEKLKEDKNLKLKRSDFENNVMVFYFNEISNKGKNFSFEIEEVIKVPNRLPAVAKVYDYYNTEKRAETLYHPEG